MTSISSASGRSFVGSVCHVVIGKLPFSFKLVIPSVVMIALVIILGVSVYDMIGKNQRSTAAIVTAAKDTNVRLVEKNFKGSALLSDILDKVQALNGTFYQILSEQASGTSKDGSKKVIELRKSALDIVAELEEYKTKFADDKSRVTIQNLINDINKYYVGSNHDGIFDVAASMMEVDISLIFGGMENYRKTYTSLQKETALLLHSALEDSVTLAANSAKNMQEQSDSMDRESSKIFRI